MDKESNILRINADLKRQIAEIRSVLEHQSKSSVSGRASAAPSKPVTYDEKQRQLEVNLTKLIKQNRALAKQQSTIMDSLFEIRQLEDTVKAKRKEMNALEKKTLGFENVLGIQKKGLSQNEKAFKKPTETKEKILAENREIEHEMSKAAVKVREQEEKLRKLANSRRNLDRRVDLLADALGKSREVIEMEFKKAKGISATSTFDGDDMASPDIDSPGKSEDGSVAIDKTVISELQRATEEATGAEKVVLLRKLLGKKTEEMVIANRRHALAKEKLNTLQKALDSRTRSYRQKEEVIEERIFELREEIRHMQEDANAAIKNARDRLSKRMEKDKLDRAFSLAPLEEIEKLGSPSPAKKPPMTDSSSKVGDPKTPSVSHDAIMTKIEAEEKHSDPMTEEEEPVHEEPKKEEEQP
ncbi:hypothetical protein ADUPG1_007997, partial [Aduncisulcus paluster]